MITLHTTSVLLYSSVAGKCKCLFVLVVHVISDRFSSVKSDPLTSQANLTLLALALQLKVAVDPSLAFTDVRVKTKAEIQTKNQVNMRVQCQ